MSKINKLTLSNFKFFKETETIELGGKHLLLYGENGSGKSSIFWGLYTLLEASMKTPDAVDKYFEPRSMNKESLVNIYNTDLMSCISRKKEHCNAYIEIENDNSNVYTLSIPSNNICSSPDIQESLKTTDFIDYKTLFSLQNFDNTETPNLYNAFHFSILRFVSFSPFEVKGKKLSNAKNMWDEYCDGPGMMPNAKGDMIQVYKHSQAYNNFLGFEKHFNLEFQKLLDFINPSANSIVKQLGYDIDFKLDYIKPTHKKRDKIYEPTPFAVNFIVDKYNGIDVNWQSAHIFLNEAKLTAIALAIRLAILEKKNIDNPAPDAMKILALDDVMISLDMSNRDKLSEYIIKNYSDKYQILLMTHNVELFDFMKTKIDMYKTHPFLLNKPSYDNWSVKEMYCGEKNGVEIPVIIDSVLGNYDKATKYFQAHNYEIAAIYLRKSIEEAIQRVLPSDRIYSTDNQVYPLNTLWKAFVELHVEKTIQDGKDLIELFLIAKDTLLNTAAHYQKNSRHIFKREVQKGFELYDKLTSTKYCEIKTIFKKNEKLVFTKDKLIVEFELKKGLCTKTNSTSIEFSDAKCRILKFEYNGIPDYDFRTGAANVRHPFKNSNPQFMEFVIKLNLHLETPITKDDLYNNLTVDGKLLGLHIDLNTFATCMR